MGELKDSAQRMIQAVDPNKLQDSTPELFIATMAALQAGYGVLVITALERQAVALERIATLLEGNNAKPQIGTDTVPGRSPLEMRHGW